MQTTVRAPVVAGSFYPEHPTLLAQDVDGLLRAERYNGPLPRAIIAPHAGYVYSGAVAASIYQLFNNAREHIHRVVVLGPSHRVAFHGLALPSQTHFATPLGEIPLDLAALKTLSRLPEVQIRDDAHAQEHGLEVHLPFLQRLFSQCSLVPVVVGDAPPEAIASVLEVFWEDPATLLVISSDLSHFLDYASAQQRDAATSKAIVEQRPEAIGPFDACGCRPINGLLHLAQQYRLHGQCVDLRNSGDTAGPRTKVVGYGAYAFYQ